MAKGMLVKSKYVLMMSYEGTGGHTKDWEPMEHQMFEGDKREEAIKERNDLNKKFKDFPGNEQLDGPYYLEFWTIAYTKVVAL